MRRFIGARVRARRTRTNGHIWVLLLVCGVLGGVARAQIEVNETGLHDGQTVYGLDRSAAVEPLENSQAVTLFAAGEVDAALFTDVTFSAYGLYADPNAANSGDVYVSGLGGNVDTDTSSANAYASLYGIHINGVANNSGNVDVRLTGGQATASYFSATIASAYANAYGLASLSGTTNTGHVDVLSTGGAADATGSEVRAWGHANAFGLYTLGTDAALTNSGDVDVNAVGGAASASGSYAYETSAGATAYALRSGSALDNSGAITSYATGGTASAEAVVVANTNANALARGMLAELAPLVNTGSVTVAAAGGTATADRTDSDSPMPGRAEACADAYGVAGTGIDNAGAISVTALGGTATATNQALAYADANGLYGAGETLRNTGAVTLSATGGTVRAADYAGAYAEANGLFASAAINNDAALNVTATGGLAEATGTTGTLAQAYASAHGINASSDVENVGSIDVRATGGTATGTAADAYADAIGIRTTGVIVNAGDITSTAIGGETSATGSADADAHAIGVYVAGGIVENAGDIVAMAQAEDGSTAYAYGIYMAGDGLLTNTGLIRAAGDTAYELHVDAGTTTLHRIYNVTLDGDPNVGSIYVDQNATLALNEATLSVAGVSGVLWDAPYRLFDLAPNGVVDGNFVDVVAYNPNTTATYYDQNSVGSADDRVALSYTPGASAAFSSVAVEKQMLSQSLDVVNTHMTGLILHDVLSGPGLPLLADAGPTQRGMALAQSASGEESGVFFEPYYSQADRDADPMGYDARLWGFAAGYERRIESTLVALHMGYGQADVDFTGAGFSANSEEQDVLTGGVSALTRWDRWTLRYGLMGFYGWHDYEGLTGLSLDESETASTDSYGAVATVMAGHLFRRGSHVLLPEAGVNWIWAHRQRYTTDASNPAWDTTYSAMDDHDLQAEAAVRWLTSFMADDVHVSPSVALGVRHLLTDAESTVTQSVPGTAPVLVPSERDRTAMTLSASVVLSRNQRAVSLAYDGEYSDDAQRHSAWLRYTWQF